MRLSAFLRGKDVQFAEIQMQPDIAFQRTGDARIGIVNDQALPVDIDEVAVVTAEKTRKSDPAFDRISSGVREIRIASGRRTTSTVSPSRNAEPSSGTEKV